MMLELRRASVPAALYLVLIAAGIFAAVTIVRNLAGDKPWISYTTYKIGFQSVKGVTPGRVELRLAGVKAGAVESTELVDGRAVMTVKLEKKYAPLRTDAKVAIRPVTALEDEYVDITSRGTADAPELKPDQILPEARTSSQEEVGKVLNVLDTDTRARVTQLLNGLSKGTEDRGMALKDGFAQLGPFLEAATRLGDVLRDRRENTARLVHNFGNLTQVLATRDAQLKGFVDGGGRLLGTLAEHDGTLSQTLASLPGTLQNLRATFADVRATTGPLEGALSSLRPVAKKLPAGLESLSALSEEGTPAVRSLRPSVRALKPLAEELPHTSANASAAISPLVAQMTQLHHGTQVVNPCLPLVGALVDRLASLTKYSGTQGSEGTVPDARAQATVDLTSVTQVGRDPGWKPVVAPCFADPTVVRNNNGMGTLTPVPSRDAAVSKEQR
jgi:virulence factor Mce-like protein